MAIDIHERPLIAICIHELPIMSIKLRLMTIKWQSNCRWWLLVVIRCAWKIHVCCSGIAYEDYSFTDYIINLMWIADPQFDYVPHFLPISLAQDKQNKLCSQSKQKNRRPGATSGPESTVPYAKPDLGSTAVQHNWLMCALQILVTACTCGSNAPNGQRELALWVHNVNKLPHLMQLVFKNLTIWCELLINNLNTLFDANCRSINWPRKQFDVNCWSIIKSLRYYAIKLWSYYAIGLLGYWAIGFHLHLPLKSLPFFAQDPCIFRLSP